MPDKLTLDVKEPRAFQSKENPGVFFEKSSGGELGELEIEIPKQMPSGVSESAMKK